MKNSVVVVLLLITFSSSAQVFKAGATLGLNASQIEGDGIGGYNKPGVIIGGFVNTHLSEKWSSQFEISYIGKGSRKNARPDKGDFNSLKVNLNYIEVPVSLRYHHQKFLFEVGLYYGILLNSSVENEFGAVSLGNFPFEKSDFGGLLGIQYQLNDQIAVNIRSKNSILPVRDFNNFDQNIGLFNRLFNRGWYNIELNFSVRYQFGK